MKQKTQQIESNVKNQVDEDEDENFFMVSEEIKDQFDIESYEKQLMGKTKEEIKSEESENLLNKEISVFKEISNVKSLIKEKTKTRKIKIELLDSKDKFYVSGLLNFLKKDKTKIVCSLEMISCSDNFLSKFLLKTISINFIEISIGSELVTNENNDSKVVKLSFNEPKQIQNLILKEEMNSYTGLYESVVEVMFDY